VKGAEKRRHDRSARGGDQETYGCMAPDDSGNQVFINNPGFTDRTQY
jgi:hypothetical protein